MDEEHYTLIQDPRVFAHRFKVRYNIIEQVFRHRGIPSYTKLLKRVLTRNLDSHDYNPLGIVVMDDFEIEDFMSRLEAVRLSRILGGTVNINDRGLTDTTTLSRR